MIEIGIRLGTLGGVTATQLLAVSHSAPYGDAPASASHQAAYGLRIDKALTTPYWIFQGAAAARQAVYDLSERDPVRRSVKAGYALLPEQAVYAAAAVAELVHAGRQIRIGDVSLSCDEDSPVWIAQIDVLELSDFGAIAIGDAVSLTVGMEAFALVVDGKTLGRNAPGARACEITASSPLALLDAPFAQGITFAAAANTPARTAVEGFIGLVDWQLPAWIVAAPALVFDGVTPLKAARAIVEAIGGLIESAPDGSVVCRPRHPVSVPDYGAAAVAHQLFDSEVLESAERIAPMRGFNRVTVANERSSAGASSSPDTLEYVSADSHNGTVRAYPNPARAVTLVHTGNPATTIAAQGELTRSESEVVEFVSGRARTRYPVESIESATWQAVDLGAVTADGAELTAAVDGYSLLDITYTVRSHDWLVGLDADEQVQFVLMDA